MKQCPQCHQTYTDETLKFCRVDGVLLETSSPAESSDTLILSAVRRDPQSDIYWIVGAPLKYAPGQITNVGG